MSLDQLTNYLYSQVPEPNLAQLIKTMYPSRLSNPASPKFDFGNDYIKQKEKFKDTAYQDQGGKWTIGYGSTMIGNQNIKPGMMITQPEAEKQYQNDIKHGDSVLDRYLTDQLPMDSREALRSFIYNAGPTAFKNNLVDPINAMNYPEAINRWKQFVHVNGMVSPGLVKRRNEEIDRFLKGISYTGGLND